MDNTDLEDFEQSLESSYEVSDGNLYFNALITPELMAIATASGSPLQIAHFLNTLAKQTHQDVPAGQAIAAQIGGHLSENAVIMLRRLLLSAPEVSKK